MPEPAERIVTVRLSRELHIALKEKAAERKTSLNQFCVELLRSGLTNYKLHDEDMVLSVEEAATLHKIINGELPKLNVTPRPMQPWSPKNEE